MTSPLQAAAIAASAFTTGSIAAYSYLFVPCVVEATDDKNMIAQWRKGYRIGFYTAPPQFEFSGVLWALLAWKGGMTAPSSSPSRPFYILAAILLPSILPFTLTIQRAINGALCARAEELVGPGKGTTAETYSVKEKRSLDYAKGKTTKELVEAWGWYNWVRVGILGAGTACGVWGVLVS